jgi:hypothetical protein
MASGDSLFLFLPLNAEVIQDATPDSATIDFRGNVAVLDFPGADGDLYGAEWAMVMPRNYGGSGVTLSIGVTSSGGPSTAEFHVIGAWERVEDDEVALESLVYTTTQTVNIAPNPSFAGELTYTDLAFTNAEIDGVGVGDYFRFRLSRDADNVGDTNGSDMELVFIEGRET